MESSEVLATGTAVAVRPFEAFFEEQHVRLARALYLLTGSASEADELAQEALVRVYEPASRPDETRAERTPRQADGVTA